MHFHSSSSSLAIRHFCLCGWNFHRNFDFSFNYFACMLLLEIGGEVLEINTKINLQPIHGNPSRSHDPPPYSSGHIRGFPPDLHNMDDIFESHYPRY